MSEFVSVNDIFMFAYSENDRTAERICKEEYVSQMLFGIPPCAAFTSTFTFSEDLKFHSD